LRSYKFGVPQVNNTVAIRKGSLFFKAFRLFLEKVAFSQIQAVRRPMFSVHAKFTRLYMRTSRSRLVRFPVCWSLLRLQFLNKNYNETSGISVFGLDSRELAGCLYFKRKHNTINAMVFEKSNLQFYIFYFVLNSIMALLHLVVKSLLYKFGVVKLIRNYKLNLISTNAFQRLQSKWRYKLRKMKKKKKKKGKFGARKRFAVRRFSR